MDQHGVLSFVTVVFTDVVDGILRRWVADGQHRFDAMVLTNRPILYTITTVDSLEELVRLIANLNNTSATWVLVDYLGAWCALKIQSYEHIKTKQEETKLPLSALLGIYANKERRFAADLFRDGKYKITSQGLADKIVAELVLVRKLMPRSLSLTTALSGYLRKAIDTQNFDRATFRSFCENTQNFGESEEETRRIVTNGLGPIA